MNGVHDMGGMHGFGPIVPEPEGSPFHAAWEGRAHALNLASPTRAIVASASALEPTDSPAIEG